MIDYHTNQVWNWLCVWVLDDDNSDKYIKLINILQLPDILGDLHALSMHNKDPILVELK